MGLSTSSDTPRPRARGGGFTPGSDIRDQLRGDHEKALAELEALRAEGDAQRCYERLTQLRRGWVIHALAEETVVYRAIEGVSTDSSHSAGERFDAEALAEMGQRFELAREKLTLLEEAKAT